MSCWTRALKCLPALYFKDLELRRREWAHYNLTNTGAGGQDFWQARVSGQRRREGLCMEHIFTKTLEMSPLEKASFWQSDLIGRDT